MYTYNFKTKEFANALDKIKFVVFGANCILPKGVSSKECKVVSLFEDRLYVAYPIAKVTDFAVITFNGNSQGIGGTMQIDTIWGKRKYSFSVQNEEVLYLSNQTY